MEEVRRAVSIPTRHTSVVAPSSASDAVFSWAGRPTPATSDETGQSSRNHTHPIYVSASPASPRPAALQSHCALSCSRCARPPPGASADAGHAPWPRPCNLPPSLSLSLAFPPVAYSHAVAGALRVTIGRGTGCGWSRMAAIGLAAPCAPYTPTRALSRVRELAGRRVVSRVTGAVRGAW
jgi:hypothetical protein